MEISGKACYPKGSVAMSLFAISGPFLWNGVWRRNHFACKRLGIRIRCSSWQPRPCYSLSEICASQSVYATVDRALLPFPIW